jgi:hypothetical protein
MSNVGRGVARTPADNAAADPPAGRTESEAAPSANERAGRGLGWNTAEILALCSSGLTVDRDNVRGAGMKKAGGARRLQAEFKRSPNIPESVIIIDSSADNGDSNDSRRWLGRTSAAQGEAVDWLSRRRRLCSCSYGNLQSLARSLQSL